MPRIDPHKLLTCLSVLLAQNGGIRSSNEVRRLAGLMAKFSKKLVSKCIYIQILKCTETDLLCQFMSAGGWSLVHMWLSDGILTKNWPLVQEILELLLLCPVDVSRLKSNSSPKLVKILSKEGGNEAVRILATKLVQQWLKFVKSETLAEQQALETKVKTDHFDHEMDDSTMGESQSMISNDIYTTDSDMKFKADGLLDRNTSPVRGNDGFSDGDNRCDVKTQDRQKPIVLKITVNNAKQVLTSLNKSGSIDGVSEDDFDYEMGKSTDSTDSKQLLSDDSTKTGESNKVATNDVSKERSESGDKLKKRERDRTERRKDDERENKKSDNLHRSSSSSLSHSKSTSKHHSTSKKSSSSSSSSHKSSNNSGSGTKSSESKSTYSSTSSSSKSRDKSRDKSRVGSSSSSSKDRDRSRDKDSDRYKDKDKLKRDQDRSKDYRDKDKATNKFDPNAISEKDKETLAKMTLPSINKLGKIPKKISKDDEEKSGESADGTANAAAAAAKKASISIEVRKDSDNRPKTVKTFNSKFRSHGLSEEAPPPPSRRDLKRPAAPTTTTPPTVPKDSILMTSSFNPVKRSSSPPPTSRKEAILEKKLKIDASIPEKPGGIKLISPKPSKLVESDMFMDAIFAASTKKDLTRKRKRKLSITGKDGSTESTKSSDDKANADSTEESDVIKEEKVVPSAPLKFYQDTLVDDDKTAVKKEKDDSGERQSKTENDEADENSDDIKMKNVKNENDDETEAKDENKNDNEDDDSQEAEMNRKKPGPGCGPDGPPGVLVIHRRKGPKKQLKWKPAEQLEEIRYFESDENERINVTKTFVDMKQMERYSEREAFSMARKMPSEDTMVEQTEWKPLIEVDDVPPHMNGSNSKERKIQQDRERTVLKALYFNLLMIPDSPAEPDIEQYKMVDPQIIPFDDITGSTDTSNKLTDLLPWPEPKGSPPHNHPGGDQFQNFNTPFPFMNSAWPQNGPGAEQQNMGMPNNMNMGNMPNNVPAFGTNAGSGGPSGPANMMNMGPMDQRPPFGAPGFGGPGGPGGFNNNFPPPIDNMRMQGPGGPRGGGGGPGGGWFRPMGAGPNMNNWRPMDSGPGMLGPPPMMPNGPGGPGGSGFRPPRWLNPSRLCKAFQRGYCRKGDKCNFLHPGINCPPY